MSIIQSTVPLPERLMKLYNLTVDGLNELNEAEKNFGAETETWRIRRLTFIRRVDDFCLEFRVYQQDPVQYLLDADNADAEQTRNDLRNS